MSKKTVLVVEDDPAIRRGIVDALQFQGFHTLSADRGDEGLSLALGAECDLLVLDVVLPARDGFAILRELHHRRPNLPVILLTARGEEADRVHGLQLGADDYIVKPFSIRELLARIDAVLRRSPGRTVEPCVLSLAGCTADVSTGELRFCDGDKAQLTDRESQLLRYLAAHCERVVGREELLQNVWGVDPTGVETRTVDMQIVRLREKLRDAGKEPKILTTVRGKGYRLFLDGAAS